MKLIIMGPPGAGKGTQATIIAERLGIPHISTGEILLENIREGTPLGKRIKKYYEKGELVPNDLIIEIIKERLSFSDCLQGFVLDGFPRNLTQAEELDKITQIDMAINILVSDEEVIKRMTGRRICECGAYYNLNIPSLRPKKDEICDKCGRKLIQRPDDNEKAIKERLKVYTEQVKPMIEYYKHKGILKNIDGSGTVDEVSQSILEALKQ